MYCVNNVMWGNRVALGYDIQKKGEKYYENFSIKWAEPEFSRCP